MCKKNLLSAVGLTVTLLAAISVHALPPADGSYQAKVIFTSQDKNASCKPLPLFTYSAKRDAAQTRMNMQVQGPYTALTEQSRSLSPDHSQLNYQDSLQSAEFGTIKLMGVYTYATDDNHGRYSYGQGCSGTYVQVGI